jgi:hypothetical protein
MVHLLTIEPMQKNYYMLALVTWCSVSIIPFCDNFCKETLFFTHYRCYSYLLLDYVHSPLPIPQFKGGRDAQAIVFTTENGHAIRT